MYSNPNPPPPQPPQQQYPQAPAYQPAQQQPVYVTQQPAFVQLPPVWGMNPQACVCPNCRNQVVTRIVHEAGLATWLAFGGLILIGCWLGCCLIPFCIDAGKDVKHYCPNCNNLLGVKAVIS